MKKIFFICNHASFFVSHRLKIASEASKILKVKLCLGQAADHQENNALNILKKKKINYKKFYFKSSSFNLFAELIGFFHLFFYILIYRPSCTHLISPKAILYGGIISRLLNIHSVVISISGIGSIMNSKYIYFRKMYFFFLKYILSLNNKKIIFHNKTDLEFFKNKFKLKDSECILTFGSGVDFNKVKVIKNSYKENKLITFPARALIDKGIIEYIKCAKILKKKYPDWKFQIVGSLNYQSPMLINKKIIYKYYKNNTIKILNYKKNILNILKKSTIICLPTYREGMPKVLLEASLLGKPIVTTDIPGCREIIKLFKNGILVKKKNISSLKKGLEKLMTNKILLNKFKKNINFSNFESLNEDYVVKKNINCYLELLNR